VKICGVDPGLTGAIAFIDESLGKSLADFTIVDAPRMKVGRGGGALSGTVLAATLRDAAPDLVVIERQQAMPRQGVSSTFKIGYGAGLYLGICIALGLRVTVVHPRVWQREMYQGAEGEGKDRSLFVARLLFPTADLPRGKSGRADALLLAEYGRRKFT